jgi:hypothetical protein
MEKQIDLFISKGEEVHSNNFREKGTFIIDKVFLVPNHPTEDKGLVAIIKAHHKEITTFRVEATSDKFELPSEAVKNNMTYK